MGWREAQPGQPAGAAGAAAQEQLSIVRDFPSPKAADMPKHGKVRGRDLASISPCSLPQNGPRSRRIHRAQSPRCDPPFLSVGTQVDETGAPHVGGNQWAGGTGGRSHMRSILVP